MLYRIILSIITTGCCTGIFGQIINQKGLFLSYSVEHKFSEDQTNISSFIILLDSISTKENISKNIFLINNDSILHLKKYEKKIYSGYSLYLNNIFFSSDSMASTLKSYATNFDKDDFDSIIEKNCIYNKHIFLKNKDKNEFAVNEYILSYKLFYANLTYVDHPIRKESTFFTTNKWSWDAKYNAYLLDDKQTTETVGVLLKIE